MVRTRVKSYCSRSTSPTFAASFRPRVIEANRQQQKNSVTRQNSPTAQKYYNRAWNVRRMPRSSMSTDGDTVPAIPGGAEKITNPRLLCTRWSCSIYTEHGRASSTRVMRGRDSMVLVVYQRDTTQYVYTRSPAVRRDTLLPRAMLGCTELYCTRGFSR